MKMIYKDLVKPGRDEVVLVGGSEQTNEICDDYGFERYITVQEMAGLFPELVPLTHKAGYPRDVETLEQRVLKRFGID
jgi:hypothetical protein